MPSILVVDDDCNLVELVSHILEKAGFVVTTANNGAEALQLLQAESQNLAFVDVMMPVMDGWELCRRIRRFWKLPIILLTAKGQLEDKIKGFDLGVDDYLVKPFEAPELLARVKAVLRRAGIETTGIVKAGSLMMDKNLFLVSYNNSNMTLPLKEFDLLFKLCQNPGRTYTREQLLKDLWGTDFDGVDRTVDVHINRLREKFPAIHGGIQITTIRGLGYRLEIVD